MDEVYYGKCAKNRRKRLYTIYEACNKGTGDFAVTLLKILFYCKFISEKDYLSFFKHTFAYKYQQKK